MEGEEKFLWMLENLNALKSLEVDMNEAFAITELRDSVFDITTKVDPSLIDANNVKITMQPFTDPNTNIKYNVKEERRFVVD